MNIWKYDDNGEMIDKATFTSEDNFVFRSTQGFNRIKLNSNTGLDNYRVVYPDPTELEIIGDTQKTLYPDILETLKACETLAKDGFVVLAYSNDDPVMAKHLENAGASAVMPLAAPIGSGLGIQNRYNIAFIKSAIKIPVIVDAGVGCASDAAIAMELGADGVLTNTAIAQAKNPILMAQAMAQAVKAGRASYLAGRIPKKPYATASSPTDGLLEF